MNNININNSSGSNRVNNVSGFGGNNRSRHNLSTSSLHNKSQNNSKGVSSMMATTTMMINNTININNKNNHSKIIVNTS
jgi:hypothetical protein